MVRKVRCAWCKIQRRKCDESCKMAPYFPANRLKEFRNAHKLFGATNIQGIMASVKECHKQEAAASILAEGNARRRNPVRGCYGVIRDLASQVEDAEKELAAVNRCLDFFRQRDCHKMTRHINQAAAGREGQQIFRGNSSCSRGGGGLNIPMRASPPVVEGQQQSHHGHQMLAEVQSPLVYLVGDENTTEDKVQVEYIYRRALKEEEGLRPFDLNRTEKVLTFQGNIIASLDKIGEQSSASSKDKGKHIVGVVKVKEEAGSSSKGKAVA